MPARPVVVFVALFWAATLGISFYRDVWPRLAASGPPPIAIDLGDEASQLLPVRWQLMRGDDKAGRLVTRITYVDADDTFQFTHRYTEVQLDLLGIRVRVPELTTTTRVTRSGALREQAMAGRLVVPLERRGKDGSTDHDTIGEAAATVNGRVVNGVFVGRCDLDGQLLGTPFEVRGDLDPIPAPDGQALSPLQPVNRVGNVRPGQRWTVHQVDPLGEAMAALMRKQFGGLGLPGPSREPLLAEVGGRPESLPGSGDPCWVITYRQDGEEKAKTWVRVEDGKVLRQEAFGLGERIRLEREE